MTDMARKAEALIMSLTNAVSAGEAMCSRQSEQVCGCAAPGIISDLQCTFHACLHMRIQTCCGWHMLYLTLMHLLRTDIKLPVITCLDVALVIHTHKSHKLHNWPTNLLAPTLLVCHRSPWTAPLKPRWDPTCTTTTLSKCASSCAR